MYVAIMSSACNEFAGACLDFFSIIKPFFYYLLVSSPVKPLLLKDVIGPSQDTKTP